jgi:hypothetical protein
VRDEVGEPLAVILRTERGHESPSSTSYSLAWS